MLTSLHSYKDWLLFPSHFNVNVKTDLKNTLRKFLSSLYAFDFADWLIWVFQIGGNPSPLSRLDARCEPYLAFICERKTMPFRMQTPMPKWDDRQLLISRSQTKKISYLKFTWEFPWCAITWKKFIPVSLLKVAMPVPSLQLVTARGTNDSEG